MRSSFIPVAAALIAIPFAGYAQDSVFNQKVAASQREAVSVFPDVGKAGSDLNKRFVSEVQRLQKTGDPLLKNSDWPKILTARSAEDLGIKAGTPAAPPALAKSAPSASPSRVGSFHPGDAPASLSTGSLGSSGGLNAPAEGPKLTICGRVLQKIKEGVLVSCATDRYERNQIPGAIRGGVSAVYAEGIILLVNHPKESELADEDPVPNVIARDSGTMEYDAVSGARKTVHVYSYVTGR